jgi:hypothetical protein
MRHARLSVVLLALGASFGACRTVNENASDSESLNESRVWYDEAGNGGSCDAPAKACPPYHDQKTFADICVAKGFQAKTCGCTLRCSGKVDVPNAGGSSLADQKKSTAPADPCSADAHAYIAKVAETREPGTSLDRCIENYVCNGNFGWCADSDAETTAHLRALGKQGCESDVIQTLCKDGSLDSFNCPDADIKKLSKVWADLYSRDLTVKRCIRNYLCSGEKLLCKGDDLKLAQSVKESVAQSGCNYWLRMLCSIGAKSW